MHILLGVACIPLSYYYWPIYLLDSARMLPLLCTFCWGAACVPLAYYYWPIYLLYSARMLPRAQGRVSMRALSSTLRHFLSN